MSTLPGPVAPFRDGTIALHEQIETLRERRKAELEMITPEVRRVLIARVARAGAGLVAMSCGVVLILWVDLSFIAQRAALFNPVTRRSMGLVIPFLGVMLFTLGVFLAMRRVGVRMLEKALRMPGPEEDAQGALSRLERFDPLGAARRFAVRVTKMSLLAQLVSVGMYGLSVVAMMVVPVVAVTTGAHDLLDGLGDVLSLALSYFMGFGNLVLMICGIRFQKKLLRAQVVSPYGDGCRAYAWTFVGFIVLAIVWPHDMHDDFRLPGLVPLAIALLFVPFVFGAIGSRFLTEQKLLNSALGSAGDTVEGWAS